MRIYTSTTFICAWHPQLMITEWPQSDLFPHIELWMQQTNVILEYKWKTEIYFVQWGRRERRNYNEERNQRVGDHRTSLEQRLLHGCSVRIIILSARWLLMSWCLFGPYTSRNRRIAVKALKRNPHSIDSNGDNYPTPTPPPTHPPPHPPPPPPTTHPRNWPFVRGIHRSPVNSPHKGQWRGALMFSLICAWINVWVNNGETGHLKCHRAHYDVTVMLSTNAQTRTPQNEWRITAGLIASVQTAMNTLGCLFKRRSFC